MNEAAKEARRAYKRKWNQEHKEAVKKHQERYWERKAAEEEAKTPANINKGDNLINDTGTFTNRDRERANG